MSIQKHTPRKERQLKFAEAGILFVLILALTIFVGVRYASRDQNETVTEPVIELTEVQPVVEDESVENETSVADGTRGETSDIAAGPETLAAQPPRLVTYAEAEQAYFAGEFAAAVDLFNAYTDKHDANAWGYYMLGLSQWKAGEPSDAEEAFLAALELKPDHLKSLINYGRILIELDRVEEARDQVELALAANPESIEATRVLARIYHNLEQLDAAATTYEKVLRNRENDAWALNNLGLIRIEQGRYNDALPPLAKAASLHSDAPCIHNNLGVALERTGHYVAAAEAFTLALVADEDYLKATESLARVEGLTEVEGTVAVDLVALAESFSVESVSEVNPDAAATDLAAAVADTAAETGLTPQSGDMEVAAAQLIPSPEPTHQNDVPEDDGSRNR